MNFEHFGPAAVIGGDGFAAGMQAEVGPDRARQVANFADFCQAHPQVIVHREVEGRVERANLIPQVGAPEGGLLGDVDVAPAQSGVIGLGGGKAADDAVIFVDEICFGIDQADLRILCQEFYRG